MASKKERQRKLAREALERKAQRQAERDRRTKQIAAASISAVLVVGVVLASLVIAGVFSAKKAPRPVAAASPTPSVTASPSASALPSASPSPSVTSAMVAGKCVYTSSGTPASRKVSLPPARPDKKAKYQATIKTNRGTIVIDLANRQAPCTVNSFVSLAAQKFFNRTSCHRLTTSLIYVLQCGDPTGTGSGGPGYQFYTENLTGAAYPAGTMAMARAQSMDSNGSQFFLVYKKTSLPPSYTPFGTIVSGLNILQNVAKAGTDNSNAAGDGHPKEKVEIESVTIKKT